MFDTMTATKALGSFCGALLIFLLGKFAAELLYHPGGSHGDDHQQAYVIDTGSDDEAEETADAEPAIPFAEVYASADAAAGEKLWRACSACHKLDAGANATGPYLHGVVDRDIGAVDGFAYSAILTELEGNWTPENLSAFLENPKEYAPKTKMAYKGMSDVEDRANLIAYLSGFSG